MKFNTIKIVFVFLTAVLFGLTFGNPRKSDYIGSDKCLSCHNESHPEICREWENTSMHLVIKEVSDDEDIPGDFTVNSVFKREDVKFRIGLNSGRNAYIGSDFKVFPLEWRERDAVWKKRSSSDASVTCFGCHTTGYFVSSKEFVELGVGCEACHGPGKKHAGSDKKIGTIVNPEKLSRDRNLMICGQCHSFGYDHSGVYRFPVVCAGIDSSTGEKILTPFQPGDDLTTAFEDKKAKPTETGHAYSLLIQTPEYYSKQLCTDCHAAHGKSGNPAMLIDASNGTCLKCHKNPMKDLAVYSEADKKLCWECHKYAHTH